MCLVDHLARLSTAAAREEPQHLLEQCRQIIGAALGARDVAIIHADDSEGFARVASEALPDNDWLWVVHRKLTDAGRPLAFTLEESRTHGFHPLEGAKGVQSFALRPAATTSGAEMVIARGYWPDGLNAEQMSFLEASIAPLSIAVRRTLDAADAERQHAQVDAIASIARLLSEDETIDDILSKICTILAGVSRMNSVTIDVYDPNAGAMVRRSLNEIPGGAALSERWRSGVRRTNPIQEEAFRTGKPVILTDIQNDPRVDEKSRQFFRNALIRSAAVVPLIVMGDRVGCLSYASNQPQDFHNIEWFEGLAAQAAMTVKGIQMYQDLAESRRTLKELNDRLLDSMRTEHFLARTDALTGIPNRRYIDEVLAAECERAAREGAPLSIAMADIDHFKEINDTFGHDAGDEVLRQLGALARNAGRGRHVAGRYGGDELIFIMPALRLPPAAQVVGRWRRRVATHEFWVDREQKTAVTVSVGVAESCDEVDASPDALVRAADQALYEAKRSGRNRVVPFEGRRLDTRRVA